MLDKRFHKFLKVSKFIKIITLKKLSEQNLVVDYRLIIIFVPFLILLVIFGLTLAIYAFATFMEVLF